jgi:hypothetical protein
MSGTRAADATALVQTCVPGEPAPDEDIDPDRLAAFWQAYAAILQQRQHCEEASWTPDIPPGPSTCCR